MLAKCVLHLQTRQANSRVSLARVLGISASTIGIYVDILIQRGLVQESGQEIGLVGRPKRLLRPCAAAGWFAGIEFDGGGIWGVAVDLSGKVAARYQEPMSPEFDEDRIRGVIQKVLCILSSGMDTPLLGVGVGTPSLFHNDKGETRDGGSLKGWKSTRIDLRLDALTSAPVHLDRGLRLIDLSERWYGFRNRHDNYVVLGARHEFSLALVQGSRQARVVNQGGNDFGFWPCESRLGDEVSDLISAPAVYRRLTGLSAGAPMPANLCLAFANLKDCSLERLDEVVADFARIIGWLQFLLDPEVFVLHGPVTQLGHDFIRKIARQVEQSVPALRNFPPRLESTILGDEAGALGAACLAAEKWLPDDRRGHAIPGRMLTAA